MLRHKALIQCARYAFGFAGLIDPDEAERMRADVSRMKQVNSETRPLPLVMPPEPPSPIERPARVISSTLEIAPDEYGQGEVIWDSRH